MESKKSAKALYAVKKRMVNITLANVDFAILVEDSSVTMEEKWKLIRIGLIGQAFMIINAMVQRLIGELMVASAFVAIILFVFYV